MFWNKYPYTDFHEMNLNWFLEAFSKYASKMEFAEGEIKELMNKWLEDGTLEEILSEVIDKRFYYIPEDFGGVGDGSTDCTDAFDQACKAMYTGDKKILMIPANKTYLIKTTIGIPEGCCLIGQGKTSVIYYDETVTEFGTGITIGGDNVMITNLTINHKNTTYPIPTGAMAGALSISNIILVGAYTLGVAYSRTDRRNVIVRDIWTTNGRYCLQTENLYTDENGTSATVLENIFVENVIAPNSCVSIAPKLGKVKNVTYNNVVCALLRGGAYTGYYGENITVSNFRCQFLLCRAYGLKFMNGIIDKTVSRLYDDVRMADIYTGNVLENVTGVASDDTSYCLYVRGAGEHVLLLDKCTFTGGSRFMIPASGTPELYFNMCKISQTGESSNSLTGASVMSDISIPISGTFDTFPS